MRLVDARMEHSPVVLKFLIALCAVSLLITVTALFWTGKFPSLALLAILSALVVIAAHRETLFGDETAISSSMVVVCASVVAFRTGSSLLGPVVCGTLAGAHWTHIKHRVWSKVVFNSAATGLAALAGAGVFAICTSRSSGSVVLAFGLVLAVGTYWLVDNLLVAAALSCYQGGGFASKASDLVRSELEMLLFGIAGGLAGLLFLEVGIWAGAAALLSVLVLVDVTVTARPDCASRARRQVVFVVAAASLLAAGAAFVANGLLSVGAVFVGVLVGASALFCWSTVAIWRRLRSWEFALAVGLVVPDLPIVVLMSVGGFLAATVGVVVALAVVAAGIAVGAIALSSWPRQPLASDPDEDLLITAAVELALLDRPNAPTSR